MQYTGLEDKNGKEIYEGDVVLFPDSYNQGGPHTGTVIFADSEFRESHFSRSLADRRSLEVIGNIYETPDLLK